MAHACRKTWGILEKNNRKLVQEKEELVTFAMQLECGKRQMEDQYGKALQEWIEEDKTYEEMDEREKLSTDIGDQETQQEEVDKAKWTVDEDTAQEERNGLTKWEEFRRSLDESWTRRDEMSNLERGMQMLTTRKLLIVKEKICSNTGVEERVPSEGTENRGRENVGGYRQFNEEKLTMAEKGNVATIRDDLVPSGDIENRGRENVKESR